MLCVCLCFCLSVCLSVCGVLDVNQLQNSAPPKAKVSPRVLSHPTSRSINQSINQPIKQTNRFIINQPLTQSQKKKTGLLVPTTAGGSGGSSLRLAGSSVEAAFPGPESTLRATGKRGAVFDVWLLDDASAAPAGTNGTTAGQGQGHGALLIQEQQAGGGGAGPLPAPPSALAYTVLALCALAALWLGPVGCLLHKPAKRAAAAVAARVRALGATAVAGVTRAGHALRACPSAAWGWVVVAPGAGRGEVGGDEEAGLGGLRRSLLGGEGGSSSSSSSSSSSAGSSSGGEEDEEEFESEGEGEGEPVVADPSAAAAAPQPATPPPPPRTPPPREEKKGPLLPPPCLVNLPGVVRGGLGPPGARFAPLDAFRGLALALGIFVESGGAGELVSFTHARETRMPAST